LLEVHSCAHEIRIFEAGRLIAVHAVLEGRHRRIVAAGHRRLPPPANSRTPRAGERPLLARVGEQVGRRPLALYDASAGAWPPREPLMAGTASLGVADRVRRHMVQLNMPRALEALDATLRSVEQGELSVLEALEQLLGEKLTMRETRRIKIALMTARLGSLKTLDGFDFSFQPSLDRNRILALAELAFIARKEIVHLLGPPGTGKTHLATALGIEAVKAGKSVYFGTLADIVAWPRPSAKDSRRKLDLRR
jgi:hypothetical protein